MLVLRVPVGAELLDPPEPELAVLIGARVAKYAACFCRHVSEDHRRCWAEGVRVMVVVASTPKE